MAGLRESTRLVRGQLCPCKYRLYRSCIRRVPERPCVVHADQCTSVKIHEEAGRHQTRQCAGTCRTVGTPAACLGSSRLGNFVPYLANERLDNKNQCKLNPAKPYAQGYTIPNLETTRPKHCRWETRIGSHVTPSPGALRRRG